MSFFFWWDWARICTWTPNDPNFRVERAFFWRLQGQSTKVGTRHGAWALPQCSTTTWTRWRPPLRGKKVAGRTSKYGNVGDYLELLFLLIEKRRVLLIVDVEEVIWSSECCKNRVRSRVVTIETIYIRWIWRDLEANQILNSSGGGCYSPKN